MRNGSVALALCVVVLVCAGVDGFWPVGPVRGASTIIVPDDYPTIQEAINNAIDGDTVFVKAGTYYEHVVVNKTVSLVGENCTTTIVDGSGTRVVINVTRNGVTVSGLTVRRSGIISWENAGIILDNVQNCRVETNMITENPFAGVYLYNSSECAVIENQITGNGGVGVTTNYGGGFHDISMNNITGNGFSAITLNEEDSNTIRENNLTSNNQAVLGHCINLYRSSNNTIVGNNIDDDDNGIRMEYWSNYNRVLENNITQITTAGITIRIYSDNNTVAGNTIADGRSGVVVDGSRYTDIYGNTIAHNYGADWDAGVRLDSAGYTLIRDNEIFDNWRGIVLYASSPYVSIYGNNVTSNEYGIRVAMGGSSYVNVSGNYVANNRGYGIDVTGFGGVGESNYATIARNLIVNNTFEAVGLGIGSNYNTVAQNSMIRNGHAAVTLERYSNYNTIIQNNMIENAYGICFDLYTVNSTYNTILNNNIINNTQQVRIATGSINTWNGSYPLGGNYWSDYSGVDQFSGPYQNVTGSDGISDTPYIIDSNNTDHFPLMLPYNPPIEGDINHDGVVNIVDIVIVALEFGHPPPPIVDLRADVNKDGLVNIVDIAIVAIHFGETS
jgi:parallel beta-helix repeat protein